MREKKRAQAITYMTISARLIKQCLAYYLHYFLFVNVNYEKDNMKFQGPFCGGHQQRGPDKFVTMRERTLGSEVYHIVYVPGKFFENLKPGGHILYLIPGSIINVFSFSTLFANKDHHLLCPHPHFELVLTKKLFQKLKH
jgi:hypothetical protein